jgi:hypothetical protein
MNDIAVPFRQLVERRLWPLAVLLLIALVAIPVLLSKGGAEPVAPPAAVASAEQGETKPIVSLSEPGERDSVRKVLGSRKNPFRLAVAPTKAKPEKAEAAQAAPTGGGEPKSTGGTSTGGGAPASAPVVAPVAPTAPVVVVPTTPAKTYELYSLQVRFGDSTSETLPGRTLKRLTALPSNEDAALIYLGLLKDRKTAVFLVDGDAEVQGDGTCRPSPQNCETLEMKRGDTAFIDVSTAEGALPQQFQLDLVKIRTKKTTDAEAAKRSYASVAKGGRKALRARVSRVGRFVFDGHSGFVVKRRDK